MDKQGPQDEIQMLGLWYHQPQGQQMPSQSPRDPFRICHMIIERKCRGTKLDNLFYNSITMMKEDRERDLYNLIKAS